MTIDVYTSTGTKKGTADLPKSIFEAPINQGLMHQAVVRQQSNRRQSPAQVKSRGEVQGSTRKLFKQKGTGRARRGSVRSPLLRGGGKAFGPDNTANHYKDMPRKMRRVALLSCLSAQAQAQSIIGLEGFDGTKTKALHQLLQKLPVQIGRKILVVTADRNESLYYSSRNIPGLKTITAGYLNPEDVLGSKTIIFMVDAIKATEEIFSAKEEKADKPAKETKTDEPKKAAPAAKKAASKKSDS